MTAARSPLQALVLSGAACLLLACAEPWQLSWRLRFEPAELVMDAETVEAEVRAGGCDGTALFSTRINADGRSAAPGHLPPGRYGFHARARDRSCAWFAEGCEELELPHKGKIEVVLREGSRRERDPICIAPEQEDESGARAFDGGESEDSSADDGARSDRGEPADARVDDVDGEIDADTGNPTADASADTSLPPSSDAGGAEADAGPADTGTPGFDPLAPKCRELDEAVVACFDFDGSLLDLSGRGNDAEGPGATFEPGLSGSALRVGGTRVAVGDDDTLNFDAFTVEVWVRSDGLANLTDESDDRSVLVDKDAQYLLGYEPTGALRLQVYGDRNNGASATAEEASGLLPGVWTYIAYVYDGNAAALYKDGQRVHTEALGVAVARDVGGPLHFGSGSPGLTRAFNGLIDAVRISNVPRDDATLCAAAGRQFAERCE